jgi:folate-binding protein YgfZ
VKRFKSAYDHFPGAVLRIAGEDHEEFLQNQGTADLRGDPGLCRYCLWLDYKGKIQADAFVLKVDAGQTLLVSYASPADLLVEKFQAHIISEDVSVIDETSGWRLLSVLDDKTREDAIGQDRFRTFESGYAFPGRRLGVGTVDYLLPSNADHPGADRLLTQEEAEEIRILAGMPMVPQDTGTGRMNPLECGILSAVCHDKGCYLGQEVVTRVHRLQRLSRQLVTVRGSGPVPELPFEIREGEAVVGCLRTMSESAKYFTAIGWLKSSMVSNVDSLAQRNLNLLSVCRS